MIRILIDATTADSSTRVFGMSLVERLLHSLRRSTLELGEVRVCVRSDHESIEAAHPIRQGADAKALGEMPVSWEGGADPVGERISRALQDAPDSAWLIVTGDTIVDARLLAQMADFEGDVVFESGEGDERGTRCLDYLRWADRQSGPEVEKEVAHDEASQEAELEQADLAKQADNFVEKSDDLSFLDDKPEF